MSKKVQAELKGVTVIGAGGRRIGEILDVDVDPVAWRVVGIVVGVRSDMVTALGLEKPFWSTARVTIPVSHVSGVSDVLVLRSSVQELAELIASASVDDN